MPTTKSPFYSPVVTTQVGNVLKALHIFSLGRSPRFRSLPRFFCPEGQHNLFWCFLVLPVASPLRGLEFIIVPFSYAITQCRDRFTRRESDGTHSCKNAFPSGEALLHQSPQNNSKMGHHYFLLLLLVVFVPQASLRIRARSLSRVDSHGFAMGYIVLCFQHIVHLSSYRLSLKASNDLCSIYLPNVFIAQPR